MGEYASPAPRLIRARVPRVLGLYHNHFCSSYFLQEYRMAPKRSFSAKFKLNVVALAEVRGKHFAAKTFNVHRKRVQEWCKMKQHLIDAPTTEKRKPGGGRKLKYPDIDATLMDWFQERRSCGVRVTGKSLRQEALRLHRENGSQSFKASNGWYKRFKTRHHISLRRTTHIAQHAVQITDDRIDKFLRYVTRMRRFPARYLEQYSETVTIHLM